MALKKLRWLSSHHAPDAPRTAALCRHDGAKQGRDNRKYPDNRIPAE